MKKALCLYILGSYQLAFFCDRNFCRWQKTFSVTETFFLWQQCVSLTKTWTLVSVMETCFLKENFTLTEICVSKKLVSVTLTFFCEGNLFLSRKVTIIWFCDRNLFCQNYPFFILYVISREKFPWEMGVSVISDNQDNHFVEPCSHVSPDCQIEWLSECLTVKLSAWICDYFEGAFFLCCTCYIFWNNLSEVRTTTFIRGSLGLLL